MPKLRVAGIAMIAVIALVGIGFLSAGCGRRSDDGRLISPEQGVSNDGFGSDSHSVADNGFTPAQRKLARHLRHIPTIQSLEPWRLPDCVSERSTPALIITTRHYRVHTTLQDPLILRQVPMVLESAFLNYCNASGGQAVLAQKLPIYLFDSRTQWEQFTEYWAGPQAPVYLQIASGAYFLNGACVSYHISRRANLSVLAHEGWHQFCSLAFNYHLPAWLNEGMATNFEAYQKKDGNVEFAPRINGGRLMSLRNALTSGTMFHISELLRVEPGGIIARDQYYRDAAESDPRVAAYYAQVYALIRFLREYNYGWYAQRLEDMLAATRNGMWSVDPELIAEARQRVHNPTRRWNAMVGPWLFRTYIGVEAASLEPAYLSFCRTIATTVQTKSQ